MKIQIETRAVAVAVFHWPGCCCCAADDDVSLVLIRSRSMVQSKCYICLTPTLSRGGISPPPPRIESCRQRRAAREPSQGREREPNISIRAIPFLSLK